jgi:hypothetical protein
MIVICDAVTRVLSICVLTIARVIMIENAVEIIAMVHRVCSCLLALPTHKLCTIAHEQTAKIFRWQDLNFWNERNLVKSSLVNAHYAIAGWTNLPLHAMPVLSCAEGDSKFYPCSL